MAPPKKYKKEFVEIAYNACSKNGAGIVELANMFDVTVKTIHAWMREYPEFKKAVVDGRDEFDIERVERRLVDLALGYEYEEVVAEKDEATGKIRARRIKKQVPPNPTAIIFFLKNRQPARWRDRVDTSIGNLDITVELPDKFSLKKESEK